MATGHDISALKKEAQSKMDRGRQGMDQEIQRLRTELSPTRVAHKVMDQHSGAILVVTFGIGLVLPLLLFRSLSKQEGWERRAEPRHASNQKGPLLGSLLSQALGLSLPFVIKSLANQFLRPKVAEAEPT
jgi:hypothetical protein